MYCKVLSNVLLTSMRKEFPIDFSEVFLVNDSIRAFLTRERRKMNLVDVGMSFITFKPLLNELHFKGKKRSSKTCFQGRWKEKSPY